LIGLGTCDVVIAFLAQQQTLLRHTQRRPKFLYGLA
jgi:hypothetical protein